MRESELTAATSSSILVVVVKESDKRGRRRKGGVGKTNVALGLRLRLICGVSPLSAKFVFSLTRTVSTSE
jgi:hypothetical protein